MSEVLHKKIRPWAESVKPKNNYSQFGEDGYISAIFEKIGVETQYCVDVGAADGLFFSNVRQFVEQGWRGLLIESDAERFRQLQHNSFNHGQFGKGQITLFNYLVKPDGGHSLDTLLEKAKAPVEFDLLSIDVDGQDYYIFNSMLKYRPRVVVVEYDPAVDSMFIPKLGGEGQAGWNAITYVGAARGYSAIFRTQTNIIFIRQDIAEKLAGSLSNEMTVEQDKPVNITAVMSVPRLGFNDTWGCIMQALGSMGIKIQTVSGVFWGQCMTRGIEKALEAGADMVLCVDYDSVFDASHVAKLCELLADNPEFDVIVPRQMKREADQVLFKMNAADRDFSKPITQIATGHFGLTVFDKNVFSRMPKPWFHDQPSPDGAWNDGRVDSDIWFWHQIEKAGLKVGLANEVSIGHLELQISWCDNHFHKVSQSITDY